MLFRMNWILVFLFIVLSLGICQSDEGKQAGENPATNLTANPTINSSNTQLTNPAVNLANTQSPSFSANPIAAKFVYEKNGIIVDWKQKIATVRDNMLLKLKVNPACYVYAYSNSFQSSEEFVPVEGLSLTPEQFVNNECLIALDLATLSKSSQNEFFRRTIVWYCSPQKLDKTSNVSNSIKNALNSNSIVFKGFDDEGDEEKSPKPIEYHTQKRILFAFFANDFKAQVLGEFTILHTPLQIAVFMKERRTFLQHNDVLYGGESLQIRVTNHDPRPFYLYVFHCDEYKKVSQLVPRKNQTNVCIQPSETIFLKSANEYYRLDEKPGWEYTFFFYREKPDDATILRDTVAALAQNAEALKTFVPGDKGNYLMFRNYSDIVSIEEPNPDVKELQKNWKDVIVLKFYKKEKK